MKWNLNRWLAVSGVLVGSAALLMAALDTSDVKNVITGTAAFTSYKEEKPGTLRKITVADLPKPTKGVANQPKLVAKPSDAWPQAPQGFKVELYAEQLEGPREIRAAPNGDLFVSESTAGTVEVFRGIGSDGKPKEKSTFATGLRNNFGIAFYPLGANPKWVYFANTNSVIRYAYHNGDLKATG
ncbi:MAG TPA: sorbosone dehydrogenase family protein, partial [Bryobacteraceae bacterium]